MEDLIVKPIERKMREIGEIEDINVLVSTGYSVITVSIYDHVSKAELDTVFNDIRNKIDDLKPSLPEGTEGPFVNTDYGDVSIATVAVTGDGFSGADLRESADDLREFLYEIDGISKVSLFGVQEERIWLEIDTRKLAAVGIQLQQVLNDLQAQNVILPAGQIDADGVDLILEANGDLQSVEAIANVLTKVEGLSGFVRLKDLMNVQRGYEDPVDKPVYFNGMPAVILAVEMSDEEDIQKIGAELERQVAAYELTQPIGITYQFSTFQETNVTTSINAALMNVAQTFVVVLAVMLIFLGFRAALIIACIVPFTVTFALIGMGVMAIDLQQISIAAVIISLGLLVDNGLVVVEDIQGRIGQGVDPNEAALAAGRQFFVPLAVASITTVSAFLPMLILDGTEGEFAFSLGAVVGIMLAGSWLTALYILPSLCVWFSSRKQTREEGHENWLVRFYGAIISRSLPFGIVIIIVAYALVALSISMFPRLKSEMFPLSERAEYLIYLDMPKGTAISATEAEALAVDRWLRDKEQNPEVVNTTVFVGDGGPRFYLALNPADTNPASAFILVNTTDFESAVTAAERATRHLITNHPGGRFKVKRLSMGGGESGIVDVKISGPGAEELLFMADEVEQAFDAVPGISQNENDWGNKTLKIVIDVDQSKARELGVSSQEISDLMDTFYSGTSFSTFREGDQSIPIVVRAEEGFRSNLEDLASLAHTDGRAADLARSGRDIRSQAGVLADTSRESGAPDQDLGQERYRCRQSGAGDDPTNAGFARSHRRLQAGNRRRDRKQRGGQRKARRRHAGGTVGDAGGADVPVQLGAACFDDLHDGAADHHRRTLCAAAYRRTAVLLRYIGDDLARRHHHQQCHRADRPDRYREADTGSESSGGRGIEETRDTDHADVLDDDLRTVADGDQWRCPV